MNITNVLVDIDSLKVVDFGRNKLPYELEIKNVDVDGIPTKTIYTPAQRQKFDEKGNELFALPLPDKEITQDITNIIESTDVTDEPIMITEIKKVPLLDANGKQVQYEIMQTVVTPATFDEEGNELTPEETKQVGTGQYQLCYTVKEDQVQKVDSDGNKLYYKTKIDTIVVGIESNQYKEITKDDPEYVDGLNFAVEDYQQPSQVPFNTNYQDYFYSDIIATKEQQLLNGTLYSNSLLYEIFHEDNFDLAQTVADFVFDKVSLPVNGKTVMKPVTLPKSVFAIKLVIEANDNNLSFKVNGNAVNTSNDIWFSAQTNQIAIEIDNQTGKRVDINSLAILS